MTVKSELGGEQIDIISWSDSISELISESLLPAEVGDVRVDNEKTEGRVEVSDEQIPITIGRSGQNVRLAAKLTGWTIIILDGKNTEVARANPDGDVHIARQENTVSAARRNNEEVGDDVADLESDKQEEVSDEQEEVLYLHDSVFIQIGNILHLVKTRIISRHRKNLVITLSQPCLLYTSPSPRD